MTKLKDGKNSKIKVMHVLSKLDTGGLENGIINLCNNLDREKFEPMICCLNDSGLMAQRLKADVKLFNLNLPDERNLLYALKLSRFYRKERPDIVHAHGWGQCSLYAVTGARIAGVPIVINGEHGAVFTRKRQIFLQKITALLSTILLSVSESLKVKVAEELGIPARKIKVINNGVDTQIFTGGYDVSGLKEELIKKFNFHIDTKTIVIGSVGSLKRQKNQIILLEALKALNMKDPDNNIKVIFAGNGPDKLILEKYVTDNNMKGQAVFLGERNDIPRLLSLFDIFVSTSLNEGFSNVILESLSSAVPVIATKSVGTPELVYDGTNGFIIYPPVEAASFAEKIKLLADNPRLLKELSDNARRIIKDRFSIKSMISSYEKLYSDCLN